MSVFYRRLRLLALVALASAAAATAQTVTRFEYFIDVDPGVGNATPVPVSASGSVTTSLPVPTTGLTAGLHTLHTRALRSDGRWSPTRSRPFFVTVEPVAPPSPLVTAAEYFVDVDPGVGAATPISGTSAATITRAISVASAGLAPGLHSLHVRVRGRDGRWSPTRSRPFFVTAEPVAPPTPLVTAAEYFVDVDPGVGSATPISVASAGTVSPQITVPTAGLAPGLHSLHVRSRGRDGRWSPTRSRPFFVTAAPGTPEPLLVVAVEYFVDVDPGVGSATLVPLAAGSTVEDVFEALTTGLPPGDHRLFVRALNSEGRWGYARADSFTVAGTPPQTYAVTSPSSGELLVAGRKVVVRWSGPGVPAGADSVRVLIRRGAGAPVLLGTFKNTGKAKVTLPAGSGSGSDYTILVRRQTDASVFGASSLFAVSNEAEQYVVSEPDQAENWRRGTTKTVLWATPSTAPASTVTVELMRGNTVVATFPGEPDDGSIGIALAPTLQVSDSYTVRITNDADAAFFGKSPRFGITRFEVTDPAEGVSWAAGSSQTVNWTAGGAAGGTVRVSLRRRSVGGGQSLAINVPYTNYTRTVTIPAAAVAASDYFLQLTYVNGTTTYVVNSNTFTVTGPAQAPAPQARHFDAPAPVAYASETMLVVRGLSDGTEVGAFAGDVLVASARVEGGEAVLTVSDEIVVEGEEWAFAPDAALSLRVFAGGSESVLEAPSVVRGSDGAPVETLALVGGEVLVVGDAAAAASEAPVFALSGVVPNPSSGAATVRFSLPAAQAVTVAVYDVLGRRVATLLDGVGTAGANAVPVSAGSLAAGIYVVRVASGAESAAQRFTVVR